MFKTLRDYTFVTILGKGTFGTVYLVRRKKDSKPFVVKQQPLGAVNTLSFKIVQEEIQCLRRTRHPNIVDYRDAWIEGKHSYILMEYATRCTLKDLLTNRGIPLKEEDALYLFSQIVLGVHHIHYKNILHRDLKPENIMLTGHNGDIVKIGDFGVSETYGKLLSMSGLCRAGSLYYMAPEMVVGYPYDFKCDVWSMGVVLYEMVTNDVPFPTRNLEDLINLICNEKPKPFRRNASAPVISLVSKMLRKEAVQRPSTNQLLLCPYLVPYVVRIHLNLGQTPCMFHSKRKNFSSKIFRNYLKPCVTGNTIQI